MLAPLRGLRPLHFTSASSGSGTFFMYPCSFFSLSWQSFTSSHRISFEQRLAVEPATHTCACSRGHHGGRHNAGCASAKLVRKAFHPWSGRRRTSQALKKMPTTAPDLFSQIAHAAMTGLL